MNDFNTLVQRTPPPGDWPSEELERFDQYPVCTSVEHSITTKRIHRGVLTPTDTSLSTGRENEHRIQNKKPSWAA